ncbi:unnamed protein product [Adineta steineri]|uniref:Uncharacterized protein n=1 Tax=Adineta steineri TaxID=433720 RepID=A0A813PV66_9BILA|nr:unnamed protein product [Adineta steineri]
MFAKQSHLTMPPPLWLHVDGVSLPTDIHQYQSSVRSYDYQTKHLQSPAQSPPPTYIQTFVILNCLFLDC